MIHSTWQCFKSWSNESESCHDSWLELTGYYRSNEQKLSSTLIKGHQKLNRLKTDECLGRSNESESCNCHQPQISYCMVWPGHYWGFPKRGGGGPCSLHWKCPFLCSLVPHKDFTIFPCSPTKISPCSLVSPEIFHHVPLFPHKDFTMFPCSPQRFRHVPLFPQLTCMFPLPRYDFSDFVPIFPLQNMPCLLKNPGRP